MEDLPDIATIQQTATDWLSQALAWLQDHAWSLENLVQVIGIGVALLLARFLAPRLAAWLATVSAASQRGRKQLEILRWVLEPLMLPVIWLVLLWFSVFVAAGTGWGFRLTEGVVSLLTAWVIIRLAASVVMHSAWSKAIAVTAWTVAALNILGLLGPTVEFLDALAIHLGAFRLSVLGVVKALIALGVFLWLASAVSRMAENRIRGIKDLTPSAQALFGKLLKIILFTGAIVVGLNSVGIDLTALAVFTGAIGVGIGFGLQRVFANLISGIILLMDKSVKPGDVIAIGETFGWINSLGARYVSVITRDGIEHLIPNEELISQRVENWSYTNQLIRLKLPFGVSYNADPRQVMDLAVEGASRVQRVLADPAPVCRLLGFGDSAVDMELRVWINDPQKGVVNVRSEVLLNVWDAFHENGVEIPFPQRDLHIKSSVPIPMAVADEAFVRRMQDEEREAAEDTASEGWVSLDTSED